MISLNDEGALLMSKKCFFSSRVTSGNTLYTKAQMVNEGSFLLYLGCCHYKQKIYKNPRPKPEVSMPAGITPLHVMMFSPIWFTSLRFLYNEKIVTVDWDGRSKLDLFHKAAVFMHNTFSQPLKNRR